MLPPDSDPSGSAILSASKFWSREKFGRGNAHPYTFGILSALSSGHRQDIQSLTRTFRKASVMQTASRHSGKCTEARRNRYRRFVEPFLNVQSSHSMLSEHQENVTWLSYLGNWLPSHIKMKIICHLQFNFTWGDHVFNLSYTQYTAIERACVTFVREANEGISPLKKTQTVTYIMSKPRWKSKD